MWVNRESCEGKEGVNVKVVNVKSFHYFEEILLIIMKIFGLVSDYLTSQIYLIMNQTYISLLQEFQARTIDRTAKRLFLSLKVLNKSNSINVAVNIIRILFYIFFSNSNGRAA